MKLRASTCLLALLVASCTSPSKSELDGEVRRLCAIDGGIKVYEQVALSKDKFNQYGQVNFYRPTQGEYSLGPEYLVRRDVHYYRQGNPEMSRLHYQVIRRADSKLLGESIRYGRGGGDMPGPWHGSSFSCPNPKEGIENSLLKSIFVEMK